MGRAALGCGDNHDPADEAALDPYDWEAWIELPGVARPYATEVVLATLTAARPGGHQDLLGLGARAIDAAQAIAEADALLEDGFELRDNPVIDITRPIDWGADPRGDRNWHFELNSLERLVWPLYRAYAASDEQRYADRATAVLIDWIDYNVVRDRPNDMKWHDMATGIRAMSIANELDLQLRRSAPDPAVVFELVRAAGLHARSLSDPANYTTHNHGLFMMVGLRSLLHALPELRGSDAARSYATVRLEKLLATQFSSEGIHREHSPGYHLFITDWFRRFAAMRHLDEADEIAAIAGLATTHHHEMFHPNGDIVQIGDSEPTACDCPDGATADPDGYYPEVGYAIFRGPSGRQPSNRDSFLFFEAAFHSAAHRHADFFTFEWSELGMPILVDSGRYAYQHDDIRAFFTSTRAGNTIEVDGRSFEIAEEEPYGSALTGWGRLDDRTRFVEASAVRTQADVRHTRLLVFREGDWLLVIDRLDGSAPHEYRQWFGFHEDISVTAAGVGFLATLPDDRGVVHLLELDDRSDEQEALERGTARDGYRQGWISRRYLEQEPRWSAAFVKSGEDAQFVTLLSVDATVKKVLVSNAGDDTTVSFVKDGTPRSLRYRIQDGRGQVAWE